MENCIQFIQIDIPILIKSSPETSQTIKKSNVNLGYILEWICSTFEIYPTGLLSQPKWLLTFIHHNGIDIQFGKTFTF